MNTKTDSPSATDTPGIAEVVAQAATPPAQEAAPDANDEAAGTSDAAVQQVDNQAEPSLNDVIKASLKPEEAAADTTADGKGETDQGSEAKTDDAKGGDKPAEAAKTDEEEDKNVPFHKHPRWQEMKQQRNALRDEVATLKQEREPLQVKAEQLDQIGGFMRDNMLTPQEMTEGFEVMAFMKQDPAKALEILYRHVDALELHLGKKLPQDIQERVDAGHVDTEAAVELARQRAEAQAHRTRADYAEQQNTQTNARVLQTEIRNAVGVFESDVKTRDPDYSHKQPFIVDRMRVLAQANPPKTPEDAVAIARQAYTDVSESMKKFAPARQASTTVTSEHSSTRAQPTPQSFGDVVRQALHQ